MTGHYARSESSLLSEDADNNDGFGSHGWILSNLKDIVHALRTGRLGRTTLIAIQPELENALSLVESQWQRMLSSGGLQDDLEPRKFTPLLDEYLSRVGDLDSAREEYDSCVRETQEEAEYESHTEKQKSLLQAMRTVYKDVKSLEEKCLEENSLSPSRDEEETIPFVVSIDGSEEIRSYLMPSQYWHERLHAGEFEIVESKPKEKHKNNNNKNKNDVDDVNDNSGDESHLFLTLPPPRYPPPPPPYPPPSYSDSRTPLFPNNEASHRRLLQTFTSLPNPIPRSPRPAEAARPFTESVGMEPTPLHQRPVARDMTQDMTQDITKCLRRLWDPDAGLDDIIADSSIKTIVYEVSWELPMFFQKHFPSSSQIRNVLTVTGNATTAYACSCEEYITRFLGRGRLLLEAIEKFLGHKNRGEAIDGEVKISITQNVETSSKLEGNMPILTPQHNSNPYVSNCTMEITAPFKDQVEITKSIIWLCSAVRFSPAGLQLSSFHPSISDRPQDKRLYISPRPCEASLGEDKEKSCWHGLFKDQVIAHDFPIPYRTAGEGLEISFENMTALARSIELVEVDNGIVVEGLTTLLVPTHKLGPLDGNAIQWHLYKNQRKEDNIDQAELGLLGPKLIAELITGSLAKTYHRESNPESLSDQRTFLGWVPSARVAIGSSESTLKVKESGIPEIKEAKNKWTRGGNFGLATKPFHATFAFSATPSSMASAAVEDDELIIKSTLHRASSERVVIIYDSSTKIGWLIPRANLILYLAQLLLYRTCKLLPGDFNCVFPHPEIDGGSSASRAMWASLNKDLPKVVYGADKNGKPKQLLWLIEKICLHLRKVEGSLVQLRGEAATASTKAPKSLIGVELLQVVHFEVSRFKEVKVNQPWAHISEQEPLVLFCSGLGQAIRPTFTAFQRGALCRPWCNPGIERFGEISEYLIATGRTIMCLLDRNRSGDLTRLSPSIRWKLDKASPLFSLHKYQIGESYCHHAQSLESDNDHDEESERRIRGVVQHYIDGAFVFTRRTHTNLLSTRPSRMPLATSPQEPLPPNSITSSVAQNSLASLKVHYPSASSKSSSMSTDESDIQITSSNTNSPPSVGISPTITNKTTYHNPNSQSQIQSGHSRPVEDQSPQKLSRESGRFPQAITVESASSLDEVPKSPKRHLQSSLPITDIQRSSSSTASDVQVVVQTYEPHPVTSEEKRKAPQTEQSNQYKNTKNPEQRSSTSKNGSRGRPKEGDTRQHSGKQARGRNT